MDFSFSSPRTVARALVHSCTGALICWLGTWPKVCVLAIHRHVHPCGLGIPGSPYGRWPKLAESSSSSSNSSSRSSSSSSSSTLPPVPPLRNKKYKGVGKKMKSSFGFWLFVLNLYSAGLLGIGSSSGSTVSDFFQIFGFPPSEMAPH